MLVQCSPALGTMHKHSVTYLGRDTKPIRHSAVGDHSKSATRLVAILVRKFLFAKSILVAFSDLPLQGLPKRQLGFGGAAENSVE